MSDKAPGAFVRALRALPTGTTTGQYEGRKYVASKTTYSSGKSIKLVAEETGGNDYISLNLYILASGPRLYPCEMSSVKVIQFVQGFTPDQPLA